MRAMKRTFEVWHNQMPNLFECARHGAGNLHGQFVLKRGATHLPGDMKMVFSGTLEMPSTDPQGACFLHRLFVDPSGREFWPRRSSVFGCAPEVQEAGHAYRTLGLRAPREGDVIAVGTVNYLVLNWSTIGRTQMNTINPVVSTKKD